MAFVFDLRRSALPVLLSLSLSACGTSDWIPSANVDSGTQVGSIAPRRTARLPVAPEPDHAPMAARSAPRMAPSQTQSSADYLDTPNLASGSPQFADASPVPAQSSRLPMIDSDEALQAAAAPKLASNQGQGFLVVPNDGVNMDEGLGVEEEPVIGLAQEQSQQIHGEDQNNAMASRALPQPEAQDEISQAPSPLPSAQNSDMQEIAMVPRLQSPMMSEPMPPEPDVMPGSEIACRRELKKMGVIFTEKAPISSGPSCGISHPISLQGLGGKIGVKPAVTLNCQVTLAFAKWVKNELNPSAKLRYWSGIKTIEPMGGYSCRRMNNSRQKYNPMSEHARGNAIDIGKFVLNNGHEIDVRKKNIFSLREGKLLKAVRSDSCKYFNTVLGPGSNPEHWDHFHFDLRDRKGGKVYCN